MKKEKIFIFRNKEKDNRITNGFLFYEEKLDYYTNLNKVCDTLDFIFNIKNFEIRDKSIVSDTTFNIMLNHIGEEDDINNFMSVVVYKEGKGNEIMDIEVKPFLFSKSIDAHHYMKNLKIENGYIKRVEKFGKSLPTKSYVVLKKEKDKITYDKFYCSYVSASNRMKYLINSGKEATYVNYMDLNTSRFHIENFFNTEKGKKIFNEFEKNLIFNFQKSIKHIENNS